MQRMRAGQQGQRAQRSRGFGVIEVLLAISVVVLLVTMSLPTIQRARVQSGYAKWKEFSNSTRSDPALVTYFTFEEGTGTTVRNHAGGDARGGSRQDDLVTRDGVLHGSPQWAIGQGRWPNHKVALYLPMTTDFLEIPLSAATEALTGEITIEAWVKPVVAAGSEVDVSFPILRCDYDLSAVEMGGPVTNWLLAGLASNSATGIHGTSWLATASTAPNHTLISTKKHGLANAWNHFVLTRVGVNVKVYLNGKEMRNTTPVQAMKPDGLIFPHVTSLRIGGGPGAAFVDEFAIYRRALTAGEVQARYQAGSPG